MYESPRIRRLRTDLAALERLRSESSVFQFQASGNPPSHYQITYKGKGLSRDRGKVKIVHLHRIEIKLGSSYPRTIPEIRWLTPIYHPNISEIGMVCLGGYGTHWVPSVQLDELCQMLWDMVRYHNYDIRSPYNRDAALWVANQSAILFPTDSRSLRDIRVAQGRIEESNGKLGESDADGPGKSRSADRRTTSLIKSGLQRVAVDRVRQFIERYGRGANGGVCLEPEPATLTAVAQPEPAIPLEPAIPVSPTALPGEQNGIPTGETVPLPATVEPSSQATEEMVILEQRSDFPAASARPMPASEDIFFID